MYRTVSALAVSSFFLVAGAGAVQAQVSPLKPPSPISRRPAILSAPVTAVLLAGLTPNKGRQAQRGVPIVLNGRLTNFAAGVTTVNFGPGVTVTIPVQVSSTNTATATIDIAPLAATGPRTVTVTTGAEVVTLPGGFTVTPQPDSYGKACSSASNMGVLQAGTSGSTTGVLDDMGVQDWFTFTFGATASLTLTLTAVQAGPEFDFVVMAGCGLNQIASSTPGNPSKQATLPSSAPHTVFVVVRATRWDITAPRFTLTATGR